MMNRPGPAHWDHTMVNRRVTRSYDQVGRGLPADTGIALTTGQAALIEMFE